MAPISTSQVGGWVPLPSRHLVRPSCTASSSFKGWALKHAAIVGASSPTPSRTALALPVAILLTCVLKSMKQSLHSVKETRTHIYNLWRWWGHGHTYHTLTVTMRQAVSVQVVHFQAVSVEVLHRNKMKERATLTAVLCMNTARHTWTTHKGSTLISNLCGSELVLFRYNLTEKLVESQR